MITMQKIPIKGAPLNSTDDFYSDRYRTVLCQEQTGLTGLNIFGHAMNNKAGLPLIDHFHKNKLEFVIVVKGRQSYTASGKKYVLFGGEMFFTEESEVHSSGDEPESVNEILWFQIDMSEPETLFDLPEKRAVCLHSALSRFCARRTQLPRTLIASMLEAFNLICSGRLYDKIKGHSLFIYSLQTLLEITSATKVISEDIAAARQYITEHVTEQMDVSELLEVSGLSASRFKEKFKEQLGQSPREYINYQKIEYAKREIALTDKSITDIAFEYSFSSGNYFCMVFKQFTSYSPRAFRRKYKAGKLSLEE